MNDCQRSAALQLTSYFENDRRTFPFDSCEDINDGRGYTAGAAGFTTATHDALQVIEVFRQQQHSSNDTIASSFDRYIDVLVALNSTTFGTPAAASTMGLDGFCGTWWTASHDPAFRDAQMSVIRDLYYTTSQAIGAKLGLGLPISLGQIYDAAIQHGIDGADSLLDMIARVTDTLKTKNLPTTLDKLDETTWLRTFLAERNRTLLNPQVELTRNVWAQSISRVASYVFMLDGGQDGTATPWRALSNGGGVIEIDCDKNIENEYIEGPNPNALAALSTSQSTPASATLPLITPSAAGTTATSGKYSPPGGMSQGGPSSGLIIGVSTALALVVLGIIAALSYFWLRDSRNRRKLRKLFKLR